MHAEEHEEKKRKENKNKDSSCFQIKALIQIERVMI
jgi:hypothetical protein